MKMHFMVSLMGPPFPTLINTHMKNKHQVSVEEISISENGEELSGFVYNARIRESCRVGDVDKAMKLLAQMEALGFSLSLGSYTTVIEALGSVGRTLEAEAIFMEMVHLGLKPDLRELGGTEQLMRPLLIIGRAGRLNDVWAVIGEMSREGFGPDSFVYSKVIGVYRDNGMWKKAMEIVREIREMGVSLDKRIYNSIIDTFGKCGELSEALEVFEKMQEEGVKRI
ncbi:putative pentatricopeptide repeat-containing protein [Vitis vinifera]|uniref:Putative pentatricopeptide repeat-containing protein n=1 Tax=Vitis vinifera TaxID=29760 RepID=A0A438E240_VITVI|nr:putative pentatricopeptide repeat-containing protein [Vitis vinifera]